MTGQTHTQTDRQADTQTANHADTQDVAYLVVTSIVWAYVRTEEERNYQNRKNLLKFPHS